MRILHICSAKTIGGGERHVADLSNLLAARGHEVFAALPPDSPLGNLLCLPPENLIISRMRNALDVLSARRLAKFVREKEIEIIHAHAARDYLPTAICSKLTGKPFVLTRHVLFPMKRANSFFLGGATGVIAVSNAVAGVLKTTFPPEKITTIYNGIDLKRFSFNPKKPNRVLKIGTIGHLAPIKGHDVFIEAAKIASEKLQNVQFVIVGEDKSKVGENRRNIEYLIAKSNLGEKIKLIGWVDDIRPILNDFDLFVSAARSEPFGLVLLEAMASGVPIVATQTEGAQEIIENNKSGILTPLEDAGLLAEKILDLLNSPEKRKNLSVNGRKRVGDCFSLEKMVLETENFYRGVLEKQ
ncbi:MAG TPA: glycosyltransferase family 4 protein [Pyrinomonadaceae bacterium]|jgi:glycosyltransferase involved in cell wall biosynthesis